MQIGSDVPFFIHNLNQAIGLERGDRIRAKETATKQWFLVALSRSSLSTKTVYQGLQKPLPGLSLTKVSRDATMLSDFLERKDLGRAAGLMHNDLERPATQINSSIQKVITRLSDLGVPTVKMSGSGPTVFAIVEGRKMGRRLALQMHRDRASSEVLVCHTV